MFFAIQAGWINPEKIEEYIINDGYKALVKVLRSITGLGAAIGSGAMTNPIADFEKADVILVIGSNTTETHPVISTFIT